MFHLKNFLDPSQDGHDIVQDGLSFYVRNSIEVQEQVEGFVRDLYYQLDHNTYTNPEYVLNYALEELGRKDYELTNNEKKSLINWIDNYING